MNQFRLGQLVDCDLLLVLSNQPTTYTYDNYILSNCDSLGEVPRFVRVNLQTQTYFIRNDLKRVQTKQAAKHLKLGHLNQLIDFLVVELLPAVRYGNYKGLPGVQLVDCDFNSRQVLVVENQKHDHCGLRVLIVYEGKRPVFHLAGSEGFGVDIAQLLNFQGAFSGNRKGLAFRENIQRLFLHNVLSDFLTSRFGRLHCQSDLIVDVIEIGTHVVKALRRGQSLFLSYFKSYGKQIENLMGEGLRSPYRNLPADICVDDVISFPRQGRSIDIDNCHALHLRNLLRSLQSIQQVLRLARLTHKDNCLILPKVLFESLGSIDRHSSLEGLQNLEEVESEYPCVVAGPAAQESEAVAEGDSLNRGEIRLELYFSLLVNLLLIERCVRRVWVQLHLYFVCQFHYSSLLGHAVLQFGNVLKGKGEYLLVSSLYVLLRILLKGYRFRSNVDTLSAEPNQDRRAICSNTDLFGFLLVDDDKAPLPDHILLNFSEPFFYSQMVFLALFSQQLDNNLGICLAREDCVFQIGISQFFVVDYGSVMNQIVILRLVEMRMGIMRSLATTSCPASMPDSYETSFVVLQGLSNYFLNAVFLLFNSVFSYSYLDLLRRLLMKGNNTSAVISTVLQKFNALCNNYFRIVLCRDHSDNSATLTFRLKNLQSEGNPYCNCCRSEQF